jgi:hypothetical protein
MTRPSTRLPQRTRLTGLLAALTLLGVTVAGCSSSDDDAPNATSDSAVDEPRTDAGGDQDSAARGAAVDGLSAFDAAANNASVGGPEEVAPRSVISTGNVALRSPDVGEARFEVQKVVDHYRGEISEEQTDTDDEGVVRRSRLVVRIPTADFAEAMADLEETADLISSDTVTDDVTTKVIDIQVRLRVQRRSIARVETLLDRAQSIRDIIAIESQLSRRQAVLGSLERRQAYLADQTTMSTITVSLERTEEKTVVAKKKEKDTTGFVPGLKAGWDGLTTLAVGVATVAGALLPFAVVLLVLLVPGWPLVRRLRRRRAPLAPGPVEA